MLVSKAFYNTEPVKRHKYSQNLSLKAQEILEQKVKSYSTC